MVSGHTWRYSFLSMFILFWWQINHLSTLPTETPMRTPANHLYLSNITWRESEVFQSTTWREHSPSVAGMREGRCCYSMFWREGITKRHRSRARWVNRSSGPEPCPSVAPPALTAPTQRPNVTCWGGKDNPRDSSKPLPCCWSHVQPRSHREATLTTSLCCLSMSL